MGLFGWIKKFFSRKREEPYQGMSVYQKELKKRKEHVVWKKRTRLPSAYKFGVNLLVRVMDFQKKVGIVCTENNLEKCKRSIEKNIATPFEVYIKKLMILQGEEENAPKLGDLRKDLSRSHKRFEKLGTDDKEKFIDAAISYLTHAQEVILLYQSELKKHL